MPSSLQGHLLVASPNLGDPNFFRSVVLLVRHNEEGAFGVVLNRPSNTPLREIWVKVSESPCTTEAVIHHGGPCPGPLMAVHREEFLAESEVLPNLYFATDKDQARTLGAQAERDGPILRGLCRVAGWAAGSGDGTGGVVFGAGEFGAGVLAG